MYNTLNFTGLNPDSALFNSSTFCAYLMHIFPLLQRCSVWFLRPLPLPSSPLPLQRRISTKPIFKRRTIEKHLKGDFEVLSGPNGAYGIRTRDLNTASVARSQLRQCPSNVLFYHKHSPRENPRADFLYFNDVVMFSHLAGCVDGMEC